MAIRKVQYQIDLVHILTFKDEYRYALNPYFGFDNVEYGIDFENSISESIRLIFRNECFAISMRKEALTFVFEGDVSELKNPSGPMKIFWELYEKVKAFKGYTKTVRHTLTCYAVKVLGTEDVKDIFANNPFIKNNPFPNLEEFGCIYEFTEDGKELKLQFGNYSSKDIKKSDLTPFGSDHNKDLVDSVGLMAHLDIYEMDKSPSFNKFKSLLHNAENKLSLKPFDLL